MADDGVTDGGVAVARLVLDSIDYVWGQFRERWDGMTTEEYLWEPVAGCWTVREVDGSVRADGYDGDNDEPDPAPVTTIAWRVHHLAGPCFANYTTGGLGDWPLPTRGAEWYLEPGPALGALDTAWGAFRAGLDELGEGGIRRPLGEGWGPYAEDSWAALVLHAQDELSHHGAEISLLRDLWRTRSPR